MELLPLPEGFVPLILEFVPPRRGRRASLRPGFLVLHQIVLEASIGLLESIDGLLEFRRGTLAPRVRIFREVRCRLRRWLWSRTRTWAWTWTWTWTWPRARARAWAWTRTWTRLV